LFLSEILKGVKGKLQGLAATAKAPHRQLGTPALWQSGAPVFPECLGARVPDYPFFARGYEARRISKNSSSPRLLKKAQMQGGARGEVRGVLRPYVAAPRERANPPRRTDGPFSAACYEARRISTGA
jgi:hypothetical protein